MYVGPTPGSQAAVALNQAKQTQNTQQLQEGLQLLQTQEAHEGAGPDHDGDSDDAGAASTNSTPPGIGKHLDITV